MSPSTSFLLQAGTVLLHQEDDKVISKRTDILIRNNLIVAITDNITPPEDVTEVIDCSDTLISPDFVDTHRHLWQTQLKARYGDDLLSEYAARGYLAGYFFSSKDIQLGELSGILESIDAGTTTIVDQMHAVYSPAHIEAALEAMIASGIRGTLCPTPTRRVKQWSPSLAFEEEDVPSWFMQTLKDITTKRPLSDGRVSLGLGFDSFTIPQEQVESIFSQAGENSLHLITAHHLHGPMPFDGIGPMTKYGLMGPNILLSHCNGMTPEEKASVLSSGAHVSATPTTELQMGLGEPVCFSDGIGDVSSLGVDCHSATSSSIVSEARLVLQYSRGRENQRALAIGSTLSMKNKTLDAFNLATIKGARAVGLVEKMGSIAVGKCADLVFCDKNSPGMLAAAEHDPVAAIIHHSSVRDVRDVMIDGAFRKGNGNLMPVSLPGQSHMKWKDLAQQVLISRREIEERILEERSGMQ